MYSGAVGGLSHEHEKGLKVFGYVLLAIAAIVGIYFLVKALTKSSMANDMTSSKLGRTTDYVGDDKPMGGIMMSPAQLANFYNLTYPPKTTKFIPGLNGKGMCASSSVNNAPWDLYFKCDPDKPWSKEAIGEALALSSVGSYYLPSGPEDANLHKVVALAHDPTTWNCRDAGNIPKYTNTNKALQGVLPPAMYHR